MTEHSPNDQFRASAFLDGANADYIDQLQARYAADPASVDAAWAELFRSLGDSELDAKRAASGPSWARADWPPSPADDLTAAMTGEWPAAPAKEGKAAAQKIAAKAEEKGVSLTDAQLQRAVLDSVRALMLIRAYRIRGHLIADVDPLQMRDQTPTRNWTRGPMASRKRTWTGRSSSTRCWGWRWPPCARSWRS